MNKWMIWGGFPPIFGSTPIFQSYSHPPNGQTWQTASVDHKGGYATRIAGHKSSIGSSGKASKQVVLTVVENPVLCIVWSVFFEKKCQVTYMKKKT